MAFTGLTKKQARTIQLSSQCDEAIWEGAVSSGKTIGSLFAWVKFCVEGPPGPLLMVGQSMDTLKRNVFNPLIELFGEQNIVPTYGANKASIFGRDVWLAGADNSASERRIRGMTLVGAYVDELTLAGGVSGYDYYQMLRSRLRLPGARLFATTNPDLPTHWLHDELNKASLVLNQTGQEELNPQEDQPLNLHRYRFTIDDNTYLPPEYIARTKSTYSGVFYKRFILGEWVAAEGAIYELDLSVGGKHVYPADTELPRLTYLTIGIDHGHQNPTHAVAIGIDTAWNTWVVGELQLTEQLTANQQAERILKWIPTVQWGVEKPPAPKVIVDPAALGFRTSWHAVAGSWPRPADNKVTKGISDVGSLLGMGKLRFIEGRTPILLRELSGYVWDKAAGERGEDKPVKQNDHGPDALRYAVRSIPNLVQRAVVAYESV